MSHIQTLNYLAEFFQITYLCDVSREALSHCARKVNGLTPKTTTRAEELCAAPEVDVVLICNATAFHATHAILALQHSKHVFVEKPLALCYRDLDAIEAAERVSTGRVFVGYMRRFALAFLHALAEVGGVEKVVYARVRDVIGHNEDFVRESGTFPRRFSDIPQPDVEELSRLDKDIIQTALVSEFGVPYNDHAARVLAILGGLGSHDLSVMREALGMPESVVGAALNFPIWTATFQYLSFPVVYESGIISVPDFDAHIEIYTQDKIVRVKYDTPYVKGLPITMTIREKTTSLRGESCYQERHVRPTYEDAYTIELREWYECIINGKSVKTTIADARQDLDLFRMLMQKAFG